LDLTKKIKKARLMQVEAENEPKKIEKDMKKFNTEKY